MPFSFFTKQVFASISDGSDLAGIKGYAYEYAYLATSNWTTTAMDLKDGNLILLTHPIHLPGFGKTLSFEMAYNSVNFDLDIGIGKGWTCNLFETIIENQDTHQVTYINKTGAVFIFIWNSSTASYISPNGFEGKLEKLVDGSYRIMDLNSFSILFFSSGKLSKISRCNLDLLSIHYDSAGKADSIQDLVSQRSITIIWSNDHITELKDTKNQVWKLNYSQTNFLQSLEKPDQGKSEFTYNEAGRMITHKDFKGQIYAISYITEQTNQGKINKISLPGPLEYQFTYAGTTDGYESKTTVTDPENRSVEYFFGSVSHHLEKVLMKKDTIEVKTILQYDSFGFLSDIQDSTNHSVILTRNSDHQITEITYPPDQGTVSYQIQYSYNSSHLKTQKREKINSTPVWATTSMEYNDQDSPCKPSKITDPMGNETIYDYNQNQQIISVSTGTGSFQENNYKTRTFTYSSNANPLSSMDPEGNETIYTTNENGFITSQIQFEGSSANGQVKSNITTSYNTVNMPTEQLDSLTSLTAGRQYDGNGAVIYSTSFGGCSQASTYGSSYIALFKPGTGNGTPVTCTIQDLYLLNPTVSKYLSTEKYTSIGSIAPELVNYNPLQSSITDSSSHTTNFEYFGEGTIKKVTDFMNRETAITVDDFGRISKSTDWNGKETEFGYDTNNRLISKSEEGSGTFYYTYFNTGRLSSINDPQKGITYFSYNLRGNLLNDEKGSYSYDLKGRKIAGNYYSGSSDTWNFTRDGYLSSVNSNIYGTDKGGNVTQIVNEYGTASLTYIKSENLITSVTGNNSMGNYQLTYGPNKLVSTLQDLDNPGLYQYGWNSDNTLAELQFPNQTIQSTTFTSKHPDSITVKDAQDNRFHSDTGYNTNNQVSTFEYQIFTDQGNPSETTTAQYDSLNRVSGLTYARDNQSIQYNYNSANGLPTTINVSGAGNYSIFRTTSGKINSIVYPNNIDFEAFSYNDSQGKVTNIQYPNNRTLSFSWNSKNQITQVFGLDNGNSISYTTSYDALGRMKTYTKAVSGMQSEIWNFSYGVFGIEKAIRMFYGLQDIVMDFTTDRYGKVLAMNYQQTEGYNGRLFYHYDNYGNTAILTDSMGSVKVGYLYKLHNGKVTFEYNPQQIVNLFTANARGGNLTLGTFSDEIKIQMNLTGKLSILNPYGSVDMTEPGSINIDLSKINVTIKDSISPCLEECEKKGMVKCCIGYQSQGECEKNCNKPGSGNDMNEQDPTITFDECVKRCGNTCKEWGCCNSGMEPIS